MRQTYSVRFLLRTFKFLSNNSVPPLLTLLLSTAVVAQEASFPLEAVQANGTALSIRTVSEIAGLVVGVGVDKQGMESACKRLADSGVFASINYQYAPGPKRGYIITLNLTDQPATLPAIVDLPGIEEAQVWSWLNSKYPDFVRKIPETAQDFLAHDIERHFAPALEGAHVAARIETNLSTRSNTVVFEPEILPQISSITFNGAQELHSDELASMLQKTMGTEGFTERHLRKYLDGVIRQAYEEHGMYRVSFPKITFQKTGPSSVAITTDVVEGPKFSLGEVEILGENLPRDAMLKAAAFDLGKTANWTEIQQKIFALEKPVKRTGFFEATAHAERILHDEERQLDLHISITPGPLYHFGHVTFVGLSANAEALAQSMWKMQTGDPYDFGYASDFLRELSNKVDLRPYKIGLQIQKGKGSHVMNETISFAAR